MLKIGRTVAVRLVSWVWEHIIGVSRSVGLCHCGAHHRGCAPKSRNFTDSGKNVEGFLTVSACNKRIEIEARRQIMNHTGKRGMPESQSFSHRRSPPYHRLLAFFNFGGSALTNATGLCPSLCCGPLVWKYQHWGLHQSSLHPENNRVTYFGLSVGGPWPGGSWPTTSQSIWGSTSAKGLSTSKKSYSRQWRENVCIVCGNEGGMPGRERMSDRRLKTHYLVTTLKRRGRDELTDTCRWVRAQPKTANGGSLGNVLNPHVDASSLLGRCYW